MPEEDKELTAQEEAEAKVKIDAIIHGKAGSSINEPKDNAKREQKVAEAKPVTEILANATKNELSSEEMESLTELVEGKESSVVSAESSLSGQNSHKQPDNNTSKKPQLQKADLGLPLTVKKESSNDNKMFLKGRVHGLKKNQVPANDDMLTYERKVLKHRSFRFDQGRPVIIGGNSPSSRNSQYHISKEDLEKNYPLPKKYGILEFNLEGCLTNDISMFFSKMYRRIIRLDLEVIPREYLFVTKRQTAKKVYGCYYLFESQYQSRGVTTKIYEYQELGTADENDLDGIVDFVKKALPAYASKLNKQSFPTIIVDSSIKSRLLSSLGALEEVFEHDIGKYIGYKEEGHFKYKK